MNTKIIGSITRWVLIISGAVTTFKADETFIEAINKLKETIAAGDKIAIAGALVTVVTLGWSIWDKIKTGKKEVAMEAKIKSLSVPSEIVKDC